MICCVFFFNDTATTEIYTLSLHDALPIFRDIHLDLASERVDALEYEAVDLGEHAEVHSFVQIGRAHV